MKIKWLGHASFLITSQDGAKIITDPYSTGMGIDYGEIKESADVVLVSHEHPDHNNIKAVKGSPQAIANPGTKAAKGIEFKGIATFHDESQGKERGPNTAYTFTVDGVNACFLGDLGHQLTGEEVGAIGKVDVLMIPVGGFYTVDAANATKICDALKPKVVIPMHFKTDKCAYPIATVEDFLKGKNNIRREKTSEVTFSKDKLPSATEILVLQPAL
jgi:L-ascorbate metabolism protein UlaG (beta-lactamase superfamily)